MKHGSLFSGMGGFDLAAEWMGWENKFHCEWNEFGKRILQYYWPNAISYDDIKKTDFTIWRGIIDVLTGGFPCQPYSQSGKRLGTEDDRHLWPEMLRAIREIKPRWVVGENVYGIVNWNGGLVFDEIQADLEAEGYTVQPVLLPARSVNTSHKRDRIWFVAHTNSSVLENVGIQPGESKGIYQKTPIKINDRDELFGIREATHGQDLLEFDGIPKELDRITISKWRKESIKAAGNAVVPQVVYQIFKAIQMYENAETH